MAASIGFDMQDGTVLTLAGDSAASLADTLLAILPTLPWDQYGVYGGSAVLDALARKHPEMFECVDGEWTVARRTYVRYGDGLGEILRNYATDSEFVTKFLDGPQSDDLDTATHEQHERDMLHRV